MLIESLIRPSIKATRTVTVFGVAYEFAPLADKNRFVALVEDPAAIKCLLALPKAYREFTDALPTGSTLAKPSTKTAAPAAPPPKPVLPAPVADPAKDDDKGEGQSNAPTAEEVNASAQSLLSSTPQAIKKQIEKHPPSREVLAQAIAIEQGAKTPRPHVLACLTGALSALDN